MQQDNRTGSPAARVLKASLRREPDWGWDAVLEQSWGTLSQSLPFLEPIGPRAHVDEKQARPWLILLSLAPLKDGCSWERFPQ